jgi:hypothetical protein
MTDGMTVVPPDFAPVAVEQKHADHGFCVKDVQASSRTIKHLLPTRFPRPPTGRVWARSLAYAVWSSDCRR